MIGYLSKWSEISNILYQVMSNDSTIFKILNVQLCFCREANARRRYDRLASDTHHACKECDSYV